MLKRNIVFFILVYFPLNAYMISAIEFKGLHHLSKDSALELMEIQKGKNATDKQINKSLKNLFKQNYFENIEVEYFENNQTILFRCYEKPTVAKVTIEGFMDMEEEQQEKFLEIKKGSFLDKNRIEKTKDRILEALKFKGTVDNIVEVKEEHLDNGTVKINFIVQEGKNIIIKSLIIEGAKSLSFDKLREEIANRNEESFSWFFGQYSGEMKIKELELDRLKLKDYYMQKGFLDVKVSQPIAKIDFNRYRATVKFKINEGIKYIVKKVDIKIDKQNLLDINNTINNSLKLTANKYFNIKKLRQDIQKLKNLIANQGYAFVKITPDIDKKNGEVSVTYNIKTGELVYIHDVIISGNRLTLDRVIRREIYLAPGDLYNLTDLIDSKRSLGRLGYFDEVDIKEKRISKNQIDLIVKVKEGRTGMFQAGGGYSTYLGLTFDVGINDRNVFGSGLGLGFSFQYSKVSTNYSITLTNPRINDSLYSGTFSVHRNKMEYSEYTVKDIGFGMSIGKKFQRHLHGSVGYQYSDISYSDVDDDISLDETSSYIKSSVSLSGVFDNTDDYYFPRSGVILSDYLELAGLGGDAKFLKNTLSFNAYKGLEDIIDYDLILRYKSRLRLINDSVFGSDSYLPLNESLYMGGISSVRGYDPYSFPDRGIEKYKSIKALKSFTNSIEASIPLSKKAKLRLTGFVDYGWIGTERIDNIADRGGYGMVIEWLSPMAPIQFVFARTFNDKETDSTSRFEFMLGRKF